MNKSLLLAMALAASMSAAFAASNEPQRYLMGTDTVKAQAAPSIAQSPAGVITVVQEQEKGEWAKIVLTPTDEHLFGAFGEPVVVLTQVLPNP